MATKQAEARESVSTQPLSPEQDSTTKRETTTTIGHHKQHMEESASDTSGLATHDTTPTLPSLLQHSPTNHWKKRAKQESRMCKPQLCDCDETSTSWVDEADERKVQGTTGKSLDSRLD